MGSIAITTPGVGEVIDGEANRKLTAAWVLSNQRLVDHRATAGFPLPD